MISSHLLLPVIQQERQRDLARWQLARAATLSERQRPAVSLGERVRAALESWRLAGRLEDTPASCTERTTSIVACC